MCSCRYRMWTSTETQMKLCRPSPTTYRCCFVVFFVLFFCEEAYIHIRNSTCCYSLASLNYSTPGWWLIVWRQTAAGLWCRTRWDGGDVLRLVEPQREILFSTRLWDVPVSYPTRLCSPHFESVKLFTNDLGKNKQKKNPQCTVFWDLKDKRCGNT